MSESKQNPQSNIGAVMPSFPSDKEISIIAQKYADNYKSIPKDFYEAEVIYKSSFEKGAKWMKSKIGNEA